MSVITHQSHAFSGVWASVPTPLKADLNIDHTRLNSHIRTLFAKGVHGILLFGEMGEGSLFDVPEKLIALEYLIAQGIPANAIMLSASCANMNDSTKLIQHALKLEVHGVTVMPPSYEQQISEQGLIDYFDQLIARVNQPEWRLYLLLNAKKVTIPDAVIEGLLSKHPTHIVGLIDEAANSTYTLDLLKSFGDKVDISSTHEMNHKLLKSRGVISPLANLLPRVIIGMSSSSSQTQAHSVPGLKVKQGDERVQELLTVLGKYPITLAMKFILSIIYRDADWARSRAPLGELPLASREYFNKTMKTFNLNTTEE
jgi:4-hydroxy-tetrahydrodipicolinate synthase